MVTKSMESERHRHCMLEIILIESASRLETNRPRTSNKRNATMRQNRLRLKALNVDHWLDQPLLPDYMDAARSGEHHTLQYASALPPRYVFETGLSVFLPISMLVTCPQAARWKPVRVDSRHCRPQAEGAGQPRPRKRASST